MEASLILRKTREKSGKMAKKSLKVDREKFERVVKRLLETPHIKREKIKVSKKKPEKLIPAGEVKRPVKH